MPGNKPTIKIFDFHRIGKDSEVIKNPIFYSGQI